ncbi:hypothetical protein Kpol_1070p15 [Vanderwaltozyma polyspora DSM 70294]|uniref:Arf-GAP domain-containing protein n=1 Tax=Vanderwaltozyma polyspora (strain ATCC 22028 / DSM 70294 / BCRC 21397 / CBS 2163 / NBRC 10782 / NRRL Y-8283 / UCD 57-17) TaxID=436907 RepID=A7TNL5_VANPO|nr:uncharacterized protein Kpol_1070p15 [Vanderwaltozyma polyspora DSM 70294]EDO16132.1 hypothetical protein Kpol_1070p15 [Vanderwaltozyma polyspora DSM 70294]
MSTSPQVKRALSALLRDPGNANCADCKAQSHPRWASWSLGVFVCIKCAGVHRSLGTHISKVKSVDLDTWKEEHVVMLVKMKNNNNANALYEAKLPDTMKGPLNDMGKLQTFIKNKYEFKKWMGDNTNLVPTETNVSVSSVNSNNSNNANNRLDSPSSGSLIDDASDVSSISTIGQAKKESVSKSSSLLDLQFLSSRENIDGPGRPTNTPAASNISVSQRPDLKKSILSLYSKPAATNKTPSQNSFFAGNSMTSSSISLASTTSINNNNLNMNKTNSGMNFNMNMHQSRSTSTYNIEDDELIKNVWSN